MNSSTVYMNMAWYVLKKDAGALLSCERCEPVYMSMKFCSSQSDGVLPKSSFLVYEQALSKSVIDLPSWTSQQALYSEQSDMAMKALPDYLSSFFPEILEIYFNISGISEWYFLKLVFY